MVLPDKMTYCEKCVNGYILTEDKFSCLDAIQFCILHKFVNGKLLCDICDVGYVRIIDQLGCATTNSIV